MNTRLITFNGKAYLNMNGSIYRPVGTARGEWAPASPELAAAVKASVDRPVKATRGRDPLSPEARAILDGTNPVIEIRGRWYITAGHPGFNSRTNNGRGFQTREKALVSMADFTERGIRARAGR